MSRFCQWRAVALRCGDNLCCGCPISDRTVVPPILPDEPYEGMAVVARSDVGCVREENQDFMGWFVSGPRQLLVVCDGMGGHSGGYEASRISVQAISEVFAEDPSRDPSELLVAAIQAANTRVRTVADEQSELRGMGSTAVVALIEENTLWIGHVGDSRAYLVRAGDAIRLTRDHTQVNRMVAAGLIPESHADGHPLGHILDRSVGSGPEVEVEVGDPIVLEPHDRIVLCSDGYCGVVGDLEIGLHFQPQKDLDDSVRSGIETALQRGGPDNATIAAMSVTSDTPPPPVRGPEPPPPMARTYNIEPGPGVKAMMALVVLATLALTWWVTGQV